MKKEFKWLFILLCVAMLFTFAACGESETYTYQLSHTSLNMKAGQTQQLSISVTPETDFTATYSSSDESVATVSADGVVTAVAGGEAVVTATVGKTQLQCAVKVTYSTVSDSYTLSDGWVSLYEGEQHTLTGNGGTATPAFASVSPEVATVSENGTITAVSEGSAKINVFVNGQALTCTVRVYAAYALNFTYAEIPVGATRELEVFDKNGEAVEAKFETSDTQVVSITQTGTVTAIAEGDATVTATVNGKSYTCKLVVIDTTSYELSQEFLYLTSGKTETLQVLVNGTASSDLQIVWETSDATVAVVEDGIVTAQSKEGVATITATFDGISLACLVSVTLSQE